MSHVRSFYDLTKDSALSAKDLWNVFYKTRDKTLPSKGGQKEFEPDGSWMQAKVMEAFHEERTKVLSEHRVDKLKVLVEGVWDSDEKLVNVDYIKKNFWAQMGFTDKRRNWLYPEEALFLMEINILEVYQQGVSMSIQEAYDKFLGEELSLCEYQVYAHLRRLGFVVLRHDSSLVLTDYERKINIQIHNKKPRKNFKEKQEASTEGDQEISGQQNTSEVPTDGGDMQQENISPVCVEPGIKSHSVDEAGELLSAAKNNPEVQPMQTDDSSSANVTDSTNMEGCLSSKSNEHGSKRSRTECEEDSLEQVDDAKEPKKLCTDHNGTVTESIGVGDTDMHSESSGCIGNFYPVTWSDCFVQSPPKIENTDVSCKEVSSKLQQTSWQNNSIEFPDLCGSKSVISLVVSEEKLLPANMEIVKDMDGLLQFNVDDYRMKNTPKKVSKKDQYEEKRDKQKNALVFSCADWTQNKPKVKACNWLDHKQKMKNRIKELSNETPVSHLWKGEVTPLISPLDAWSTDAILQKLSIIKNAEDKDLKHIVKKSARSQITFDVHLPEKCFKKTMPGIPDHRVVVTRSECSPPDLSQLEELRQKDGVPIHWAVVDSGEIAFFVYDTRFTLQTI